MVFSLVDRITPKNPLTPGKHTGCGCEVKQQFQPVPVDIGLGIIQEQTVGFRRKTGKPRRVVKQRQDTAIGNFPVVFGQCGPWIGH